MTLTINPTTSQLHEAVRSSVAGTLSIECITPTAAKSPNPPYAVANLLGTIKVGDFDTYFTNAGLTYNVASVVRQTYSISVFGDGAFDKCDLLGAYFDEYGQQRLYSVAGRSEIRNIDALLAPAKLETRAQFDLTIDADRVLSDSDVRAAAFIDVRIYNGSLVKEFET